MTFDNTPSSPKLSPWLIGCAVGGAAALLSFAVDAGPLPLKLFGALSSGILTGLGSAGRGAKKRYRRQGEATLRRSRRDQAAEDLPAGADFRSDLGRRPANLTRTRFEAAAYAGAEHPTVTQRERSAVDMRCDELERSLGSGQRF